MNDLILLGRTAVLSSFEQVRDHISEFEDLPWSCIFLDEAHKIKNINASITKAYNRFICPVRFGLTVSCPPYPCVQTCHWI